MAEIQKIKATLVDKTHTWSDPEFGEMKFKFRLDDSRLLVLKCGMTMYDHHFELEDNPNSLAKLYNDSAAKGVRAELALAFNANGTAKWMGFTRLSESAEAGNDAGTWKSLPFVGRFTGKRINCTI